MSTDRPDSALEDLLARIEKIVADNGRPGEEALLDAFRELRGVAGRSDQARELLERIEALPHVVPGGLSPRTQSRVPGGSLLHKAVAKVTYRQGQDLLEDIRSLAQETRDRLLDVAGSSPSVVGSSERMAAQIEAIADEVVELQRRLSVTLSRVEAVEEQLDRLEAAETDRSFQPWYSSLEFDDAFRGSRNVILDRYHDLADILASSGGPVVDLGCGRGELVELLVTRGIEVWGVEVSAELVEFCRSIYLDVRQADAASALSELEDGSLGGAALLHVVEHLHSRQLMEVLALLPRKVRPGGIVVAETPNPTSPYVFSHSFYLDPTHSTPVHPSYLTFLFRHAGFSQVDIQWRSPVSDSDVISPIEADVEHAELVEKINGALELLDRLLLGPQDYAVIAVR